MSHLRIAAGSISHHGNSLRVPEQPNGARGKPLVRATIGISAPFRQSMGEISLIGVASAYSWIVVANALFVVICGLGLFLASGQAWGLASFALLAVAETSLLWWRLGDCLEALADAGDS